MTKMVAMPIYGKNLKNHLPPEPEIMIKSYDPLGAKITFIRKKLCHTVVSAMKAPSVTL